CSAKGPTTSLPTSFDPCCANCASASSGETSNAEKHMTAATKVGNLCDKSDEIDANMTSPQIVPKRPLADRPKTLADEPFGLPDCPGLNGRPSPPRSNGPRMLRFLPHDSLTEQL